jgi:hypothetical protein
MRRFNKWATLLWVFPGIPISFVLRDSVPWVVFLSVYAYACIISHLAAWRADEPTH